MCVRVWVLISVGAFVLWVRVCVRDLARVWVIVCGGARVRVGVWARVCGCVCVGASLGACVCGRV